MALCLNAAARQSRYPLLLDGQQRAAWNFTIQHGTAALTGICVVRQLEASLVGSVVNEFGVKVFDFTVENGRIRLANVIHPMNRWYIRRVIRSDLSFLTASKAKPVGRRRTLFSAQPDSIILVNQRRGITYCFLRMRDDPVTVPEGSPTVPLAE